MSRTILTRYPTAKAVGLADQILVTVTLGKVCYKATFAYHTPAPTVEAWISSRIAEMRRA